MSQTANLSVLMPVYNGAAYLPQAIESILAQTLADFELIAVDDGSTDATPDILQKYAQADPRIRVLSRPNTGIVGALNDGLAAARAPLVARMDADDVADPVRLEKQTAYMAANPDCVALGSAVLFTDPEGRPLKIYRPNTDHAGIENDLAGGNGGALIHPSLIYRREAVLACGGYRQRYLFIEDLDLYVRLLDQGRLANLPEVLLRYRQHAGSINHVIGGRSRQIAEIIAPLREKRGQPPLTAENLEKEAPHFKHPGDCRRKWALDAAEGGHYDAARANALLAVKAGPFRRQNWATLRYVERLRRNAPQRKRARQP